LVAHNIKVALTILALGGGWVLGSTVLLFYNGVTLSAVVATMSKPLRCVCGPKLAFPQIAIRNLMQFLDALPYFVGGLAILLNDRYQRIGDLVANTIVLRDRQPDYRTLPWPLPTKNIILYWKSCI